MDLLLQLLLELLVELPVLVLLLLLYVFHHVHIEGRERPLHTYAISTYIFASRKSKPPKQKMFRVHFCNFVFADIVL